MIPPTEYLWYLRVPRCGLHDLFEHHGGHASAADPQLVAFFVSLLIIFASTLFILLFCCPILLIRIRRIRDLFWMIPSINLGLYFLSISLRTYLGGFLSRFVPTSLWFTLVELFLVLLLSLIVICLNACFLWLLRMIRSQRDQSRGGGVTTSLDA